MGPSQARCRMEEIDSRRKRSNNRWRRQTYRKNMTEIWRWVRKHKRNMLTGVLVSLVVILLFGLASELRAPSSTTAPPGVTVVSYSAFLQQVEMGNVVAVTVQGNQINGFLAKPLNGSSQSTQAVPANANTQATATAEQGTAQYIAWTHLISASNSSWIGQSQQTVNPDQAIYTQAPPEGTGQLISLLIARHITTTTLPVAQPSLWLTLIWRFAPIVLLVLLLISFFYMNNGNRFVRSIDDRITQIGKNRVRRFERIKESNGTQKQNNQQGNAQSNTRTSAEKARLTGNAVMPVKPVAARVSIVPPVTFADVAGIDEVRSELEEIVRFLRSPEQFNRLGARIPRGALLIGPPGTGKTLLARAVAGEAGVPFFSISASEVVEMFVGVGASRVRDLFNQARQASPSVIFIDEIDAVGRKRAVRINGNDEREQTLNQLLVELDGFDERQAVVVMAATNRADILDKALLRPGRFDRRIMVSLPDRVGREAILRVHTAKTPLHEDVSLERLARLTTGMSGADLANLVNEAALCAARKDLERVDHTCFEEALARVQLGTLRPLLMSEAERRIIAYHEGGHALVAYYLKEADPVNCVTILPRGQSLGVTQFIAEEDRYNYSREMLMAKIAVGLGGRTAEELMLGSQRVTTGAENDFQVVTDLARRMVTRWGMSDEVGVIFAAYDEAGAGMNMRRLDPSALAAHRQTLVLEADGSPVLNGEPDLARQYAFALVEPAGSPVSSFSMTSLIDREIRKIVDEGHAIARSILQEHFDQLQRLADGLMECEQLDRASFEALLRE